MSLAHKHSMMLPAPEQAGDAHAPSAVVMTAMQPRDEGEHDVGHRLHMLILLCICCATAAATTEPLHQQHMQHLRQSLYPARAPQLML